MPIESWCIAPLENLGECDVLGLYHYRNIALTGISKNDKMLLVLADFLKDTLVTLEYTGNRLNLISELEFEFVGNSLNVEGCNLLVGKGCRL